MSNIDITGLSNEELDTIIVQAKEQKIKNASKTMAGLKAEVKQIISTLEELAELTDKPLNDLLRKTGFPELPPVEVDTYKLPNGFTFRKRKGSNPNVGRKLKEVELFITENPDIDLSQFLVSN
jgi:hypothetical protein